jgi:pimeloyl-ACP methyl ester carboxylesterase
VAWLRRKYSIIGPALAALVLLAGCGSSGEAGNPGGESESDTSGSWVGVGESWAIVWGEGDQGVVLAHGAAYDAASWESQGQALEENGMVALAVEDISPGSLRLAIDYLEEEYDVESVALIGASAGAGPVLEVTEEDPEEVGQIMLLSGTGDVSGLGEYPKLFVASEGEEISERARRMVEEAPGDRNEALILPGSTHAQAIFRTEEGDRLMQTILERLEEYG